MECINCDRDIVESDFDIMVLEDEIIIEWNCPECQENVSYIIPKDWFWGYK